MNRTTFARPLVVLLLASAQELTAQAQPIREPSRLAAVVPGLTAERVTSTTDSSQAYAVYLPARYTSSAQWPVVFALDPRGRALIPLRLVQPAAERLGYVVMSSYNSLSDGPAQPNIDALNAMLIDAQQVLAVDTRRLYLMGFSGTARAGWGLAQELQGHVAGLIGFGAALPPGSSVPPSALSETSGFGFFGGAGSTDFNYEEVRVLEKTLELLNLPHRIEFYDGPHAWPPQPVVSQALDWMELQAIRRDLAARDGQWIDSAFAAELTAARSLEAAGKLYEASRRYATVGRAFTGIHDVSEPTARARELKQSPSVRRTEEQLAAVAERYDRHMSRLVAFAERVRREGKAPTLDGSLDQLKIRELQRVAASAGEEIQRLGAQRILEQIFVQTSFYEPRSYLARGDAGRALAMLDVANEIRSEDPGLCYLRAEAFAVLERREDALAALECVGRLSAITAEQVAADSTFTRIRTDPRFRATLDRLRSRRRQEN